MPDGTRFRGRGLREPPPGGGRPTFGLYLLGHQPRPVEWDARWLRWPDFRLPRDRSEAVEALHDAHDRASVDRVEIACGGGRGRTGTALACIAVLSGVPPAQAVAFVRCNYHPRAVETPFQRRFVRQFPITRSTMYRPLGAAKLGGALTGGSGIVAEMVRVEPVTRQWAEALADGDAVFTERFHVPVEAGWSGFPEALPLLLDGARDTGPKEWGWHLFFDVDGALVGNGGWKGAPADGVAELGYAVAPGRQGRGIATAVVRELVGRARRAGLRTVIAHTLAQESASTSVLTRCGFTKVGEFVDPDDGPVWRWELQVRARCLA